MQFTNSGNSLAVAGAGGSAYVCSTADLEDFFGFDTGEGAAGGGIGTGEDAVDDGIGSSGGTF